MSSLTYICGWFGVAKYYMEAHQRTNLLQHLFAFNMFESASHLSAEKQITKKTFTPDSQHEI